MQVTEIVGWDYGVVFRTPSPPDTCCQFQLNTGSVTNMYVSNNVLPDIESLFAVDYEYGDGMDSVIPEFETKIYSLPLERITRRKRYSELVNYSFASLKEKTNLIYIIAGVIYAKSRFNDYDNLASGAYMYCQHEWFKSAGDVIGTIKEWSKYITAQKDISSCEQLSDGGESTSDGFLYFAKLKDLYSRSDDEMHERHLMWEFKNNGVLHVFEYPEQWFIANSFNVDELDKPGNPWDIESHFNVTDEYDTDLVLFD